MSTSTRFFRIVWRVNALLILIAASVARSKSSSDSGEYPQSPLRR